MIALSELVDLHRDGRSQEEILATMKQRGLTITEAIKNSVHLFGISLGEAKSLVATHPSWKSRAQAAQPLHEDLTRLFSQE